MRSKIYFAYEIFMGEIIIKEGESTIGGNKQGY